MLYLLDYDLRMDEEALLEAFAPFLPASSRPAPAPVAPAPMERSRSAEAKSASQVPVTPRRSPPQEKASMPLTPSPSPVRLPLSNQSSVESLPRASSSRVSPASSSGSSADMLTPDTGSTDEDEEMVDYEASVKGARRLRLSPSQRTAPYARPAGRTHSALPITPDSLEGSPLGSRAAEFAAAANVNATKAVPVLRSTRSTGNFWSTLTTGLRRDTKGATAVAAAAAGPLEIAS